MRRRRAGRGGQSETENGGAYPGEDPTLLGAPVVASARHSFYCGGGPLPVIMSGLVHGETHDYPNFIL